MSEPLSPDPVTSGLASAIGVRPTDSGNVFMGGVDRRFDEADREGKSC